MKGNTISQRTLNESGKIWLKKTLQLLRVQEYGKGSVRNYMQVIVNRATEKVGFESGRFMVHTVQHSFATHMLNQAIIFM